MPQNLTSLSKKELQKKLNKHYIKVNKYRGPSIIPTFDNVHFVETKEGNKFLVGTTHFFDANYVYGKDEPHNKEESTPHVSSGSRTFAVMIEHNRLTDIAFEINANAYETHITDFNPSMYAENIRINGRLMSQIPAKTSISIIQHEENRHSSFGIEINSFDNVADRRKILDTLNTKAKKGEFYKYYEMNTSSPHTEWYSVARTPSKMIDICSDLISQTEPDSRAAQDYRHHVNTKKISAQRQAIKEIGGSTSKSRSHLTKAWLNFRSNWIARK